MRFVKNGAFITGGASGIGRATAIRLFQEGANVCIGDVDVEALNRTADELGVNAVEVDVCSEKSVEVALKTAAQQLGGLDILVNSAGAAMRKAIETTAESDWRSVIGVNLEGTFFCIKHAMQYLEASAGGTIVNVASWHGGNATISNFSAYASSKAGVLGLTRSVALECAPRGIRVNAVCPGIIDTPMWRKSLSEFENPSELQRVASQKHPLGHIGEPEDVAAAIAFLASGEAKFITGTTLFVDGGMSVKLPHVFDTS